MPDMMQAKLQIINRIESFLLSATSSGPLPTVSAILDVLPLIFLLGGSRLDGIQHFAPCYHFLWSCGMIAPREWMSAADSFHSLSSVKLEMAIKILHPIALSESKRQVPLPLMQVAVTQRPQISRLITVELLSCSSTTLRPHFWNNVRTRAAKNSCSSSWTALFTTSLDQPHLTHAETASQHSPPLTPRSSFETADGVHNLSNLWQAKAKWASTVFSELSTKMKASHCLHCVIRHEVKARISAKQSLSQKSQSHQVQTPWIASPALPRSPAGEEQGSCKAADWKIALLCLLLLVLVFTSKPCVLFLWLSSY